MIDYKKIENCVKKAGQMVLNANLENALVEKKTGTLISAQSMMLKFRNF